MQNSTWSLRYFPEWLREATVACTRNGLFKQLQFKGSKSAVAPGSPVARLIHLTQLASNLSLLPFTCHKLNMCAAAELRRTSLRRICWPQLQVWIQFARPRPRAPVPPPMICRCPKPRHRLKKHRLPMFHLPAIAGMGRSDKPRAAARVVGRLKNKKNGASR